MRLGHDQGDPGDEQKHPRGGDRELRGAVEAEQERDQPDRARGDRPRGEELDPEPHQADQDQEVGDGGVDEDLQQVVLEGHVVVLHLEARGVKRLRLRALDLEAVELSEQSVLAGRDRVDQGRLPGLVGGQVGGLGDQLVCELRVSTVVRGERPHRRGCVVHDLAVQVARATGRVDRDRSRRPDVRLGCHRGDVGGLGDVGAGRGGPGAVGRHVDDHRHRGRGHVLDDRAKRVDQPARGVEADDHHGGVVRGGVVEGARDPPLGCRVDRRLELDGVGDPARGILRPRPRPDRGRSPYCGQRGHQQEAKPGTSHRFIIRRVDAAHYCV